jgi:hypothetical protein
MGRFDVLQDLIRICWELFRVFRRFTISAQPTGLVNNSRSVYRDWSWGLPEHCREHSDHFRVRLIRQPSRPALRLDPDKTEESTNNYSFGAPYCAPVA